MNWADRPQKREVRDYQLRPGSRPFRRAIFLPGWDQENDTGCLCVARALELGSIDLDTEIIAVERNRRLAEKIADRLVSFGFHIRPKLHQGELHRLALPEAIDFAMLDLMGTLDDALAEWVQNELGPALTPDATLAWTMSRSYRNNYFMETASHRWRTKPELRRSAIAYAHQIGVQDDELLVHLCILHSLLRERHMDYQCAHIYRDGKRTMIACRFDNVRPGPSEWPTIAQVLARAPEPLTT